MKKGRRKKLMWYWAVLTAVVVSIFWTVWYLTIGSVPTITQIGNEGTDGWSVQLPFAISRWWDIPFFVFLAILAVWFIAKDKTNEENADMACGLATGLLCSLLFGWGTISNCITVGLAFGLLFGVALLGTACGVNAGITYGLVTALIYGIFGGSVYGLIAGIIYSLGFCISFWPKRLFLKLISTPMAGVFSNY